MQTLPFHRSISVVLTVENSGHFLLPHTIIPPITTSTLLDVKTRLDFPVNYRLIGVTGRILNFLTLVYKLDSVDPAENPEIPSTASTSQKNAILRSWLWSQRRKEVEFFYNGSFVNGMS